VGAKGSSQFLEKLKVKLPTFVTADFSTFTDRRTPMRFIDAEHGEYWTRPDNIVYGGSGLHKQRVVAKRIATNIAKYGVPNHNMLPEYRANLSAKIKDHKGLTETDFKERLLPHIKIDYSTFRGSHVPCRFIHEKYGEWWQRPSDALRFQRHPDESKKLQSDAHRIPIDSIISRLPPKVTLDIDSYISTHRKARFFDEEANDWWWATPNNVTNHQQRHPKLKTIRSHRRCEQRFESVGLSVSVANKECLNCRLTKPLSEFAKRHSNPDGHKARCLLCAPDKPRPRTYLTAATARWAAGRGSARDRGLRWDISLDSYVTIIQNPCHYCGTSLKDRQGHSLDRKDNDLGYTPANVLPCCGTCNRIRGDNLTVPEMEAAMRAVLEFRKNQPA
jgi:hypothetical protein